jgi:glycosyltransferase involved in cell wall biosynthesis
MKIAYIYAFDALPVRGGNHLHASKLIQGFQSRGHHVLTFGDDSIPGATMMPRTRNGAQALEAAADVLYIRIDGTDIGADKLLVELMESTSKPMVWEINAPANERLAFSWLGGNRRPRWQLARWLDRWRRGFHALRQQPAIRREESLRRRLARRVSSATCVSTALARYASEGLGIETAIPLSNAGDPHANLPQGPKATLPEKFDGSLKVIYAGSPIYPWQGLDTVAETIRLCHHAGDPIAFILLLNQPPSSDLQAPNASIHVGVPYQQVQEYVRASDAGLVLYRDFDWSPWGFHGSPMKIFDYMACGRPVVATDVGQLAEIVHPWENGLLCQNSGESLRSVLLELVRNRDKLEGMGKNARRRIEERYNWDWVTERTLDVLTQAASSHLVEQ